MTSDSEFDSDNGQIRRIDYNFTNYVNWLGLFVSRVLMMLKNICHGWYDNCKIHTRIINKYDYLMSSRMLLI